MTHSMTATSTHTNSASKPVSKMSKAGSCKSDSLNSGVKLNIEGFCFNSVGDLVAKPASYTLELLESVGQKLYAQQAYISASRIRHLQNSEFVFKGADFIAV